MVTITLPGGNKVEGKPEPFTIITENWSEYKLEDGTILRVRVAASEIYRLPGIDPVTGNQNFLIKSTNVMAQRRAK